MTTLVIDESGTARRPANLRWWLWAVLLPGVTAWTWHYLGEPAAWVVGIISTAWVVRQFLTERERCFFPRGLVATCAIVLAAAIPIFAWQTWAAMQHRRLVAKITLIEQAGGVSGWDPSRIQFRGHSITNANLASIAELTTTKVLDLYRTGIDNAGLASINDWDRLESLSIAYCPVSDEGLVHLADLRQLEQLYLHSNGVTDRGLRYLGGFKKLQHLTIQSNNVTATGVEKLKQDLPNCRIDLVAMPADAPNADWPMR